MAAFLFLRLSDTRGGHGSVGVRLKAELGGNAQPRHLLGQSIHRHVPSVFAHGIDVGSSRMQRLSAVSSTIQGSGKRRKAMSHHLSRIVDND